MVMALLVVGQRRRSRTYWRYPAPRPPRQFILHRCTFGWYNRVNGGNFADRYFSESHFHMKQVYLLLAFERRVAILVGVDLTTGDTADQSVMSIYEFGRLITFVGPHGRRRYQSCLVPRMASSWEVR